MNPPWEDENYKKWIGFCEKNKILHCGMDNMYNPFATKYIDDYYFDFTEPRIYCTYIQNYIKLRTSSVGNDGGEYISLMYWQKKVIYNMFGWKEKETWTPNNKGLRRFRRALIYVPRKNGKSAFVSGIALPFTHLERVLNNESGLEVIIGANTREQAQIVFQNMIYSVKADDDLSKYFNPMSRAITACQDVDSIKTITADAKKNDGSNPNLGICDEIHEYKDGSLPRVITSGQGSRKNPLFIEITTASSQGDNYCNTQFKMYRNVCDGLLDAPSWLPVLYFCDDESKWEEEEEWIKCNPSLNKAKTMKYMRDEFHIAKEEKHYENDFKRKQLNIITASKNQFLDIVKFKECKKDYQIDELKQFECHAGLDMAFKNDLCALVLEFKEINHLISFFWIPEEHPEISFFANYPTIKKTSGNVIDFKQVKLDIVDICKKYGVNQLAFDPRYASELVQSLQDDHGINVIEFSQNVRNYAEPLKDLSAGVAQDRFSHNGDLAFIWQCGNAETEETADNLIKIVKPKGRNRYINKIDGFMAWLMAHGSSMFSAKVTSNLEKNYKEGKRLL